MSKNKRRISFLLLVVLLFATESHIFTQPFANYFQINAEDENSSSRTNNRSHAKKDGYALPDIKPFERFYSKVRLAIYEGKVDLSKKHHVRIVSDFENGRLTDGNLSVSMNSNNPVLLELLGDFVKATDESQVLQLMAWSVRDETINGVELEINFDDVNANFDFVFKTNSEKAAERVANRFSWLFTIASKLMSGNSAAEFYEQAAVKSENNRVFINTKILRSGLERFLSYQ